MVRKAVIQFQVYFIQIYFSTECDFESDIFNFEIGKITSGFTPVGNVRDMVADIIQGDWIDAGVNFAGILIDAADAAKTSGKIGKFLLNNADNSALYAEILSFVNKNFPDALSYLGKNEDFVKATKKISLKKEDKITKKQHDELKEIFDKMGLDDLIDGGSESESKTKPTQPTLPKGSIPKGQYAPENNAVLIGQNNAADKLADEGYDVEILEEVYGGNGYGIKETANPDFLIDGNVFDCYTPESSTTSKKICNKIREKTIEQSDRIILNLENVSESNVNSIKEYLLERTGDTRDLKRLNELIVLLPNGNIETWFLR